MEHFLYIFLTIIFGTLSILCILAGAYLKDIYIILIGLLLSLVALLIFLQIKETIKNPFSK